MTLKELLHIVPFEQIKTHIALLYPDMATPRILDLFLTHYDMLCKLTPRTEDSSQPCVITMTKWEEDEISFLDAYDIEGCEWEVALSKEIVVEPKVTASLAEIAACCLWHTSFYGFTFQQREEMFQELEQEARQHLPRNEAFLQKVIEDTKNKYSITWKRLSNEWDNNSEEVGN